MSDDLDMKAGEPGFHYLFREDAVKLGPRDLKKYMYDIKEEAKRLGLDMKVEKWPGGLMFWWIPKEGFEVPEKSFLDYLVEHMGAVPKGELDVERVIMFGPNGPKNVEELIEQLKAISQALKLKITVTDVLDVETLHISWEPESKDGPWEWDIDSNQPAVEVLGESDGTLDNAPCMPSLGEACGNCHRCKDSDDDLIDKGDSSFWGPSD